MCGVASKGDTSSFGELPLFTLGPSVAQADSLNCSESATFTCQNLPETAAYDFFQTSHWHVKYSLINLQVNALIILITMYVLNSLLYPTKFTLYRDILIWITRTSLQINLNYYDLSEYMTI